MPETPIMNLMPETLVLCLVRAVGPIRGLITFHSAVYLAARRLIEKASWMTVERFVNGDAITHVTGGGVFIPRLASVMSVYSSELTIATRRLGTDFDGIPRIAHIFSAGPNIDAKIAGTHEYTDFALTTLPVFQPLIAAGHGPVAAAATIMADRHPHAEPASEDDVRSLELELNGSFTRQDVEAAITVLKSAAMIL